MNEEEALSQPIGWWLKEADSLLDAAFEAALQGWRQIAGTGQLPELHKIDACLRIRRLQSANS